MKRLTIAALLLAAISSDAQTAKEAKDLVTGIYSNYRKGDPDLYGKGGEAIFTPAFAKALQADRQGTQTLNYDPFCECTDSRKVQFGGVKIDIETANLALAQVDILTREGERKQLRLVLLWTENGWRVDDISTKSLPSLRKVLTSPTQ